MLCIDDDHRLFELLASFFAPNGVTLVHATDGAKGLAALERDVFDAVLLDVMMPGMDGLEVCRRIRQTRQVPVIMLTARGDEADRVVGLELGADDYVPKPFSPRELLARLRAVLRRAQPSAIESEIVVGRVAIEVGARRVRVGGEPVDLTGLEFDILLALARRPGRVVPRETLMAEAGRNDVTVNDRTVDVHVSHLRKKLGDDPKARPDQDGARRGLRAGAGRGRPGAGAGGRRRVSWRHLHRHHHRHHHRHRGQDCDCGFVRPYHEYFSPEGAPFPWDRVLGEARERRPGWRGRIRHEMRLHYGAHLHRRLFHWFGAAIFLSVGTTLLASHLGRSWLAAHPGRAVFLFGFPALLLWTAAGRIARRISRPIYQLTRAAQELGQGNFAARASLGHDGIDEIGVLSSAFNDMAVRLERQLTEQRELLAAVSHELRTPLARIRLIVEIARQSNGTLANGTLANGASANVTPATLDDIEREAIEIDTLVGELLASARLEFQAVTRKPLEAGEAARRALERAGEDAGEAGPAGRAAAIRRRPDADRARPGQPDR